MPNIDTAGDLIVELKKAAWPAPGSVDSILS